MLITSGALSPFQGSPAFALRFFPPSQIMLASFSQSGVLTKDQRAGLETKLERCREPGTRDLVKAFAAMRQDEMDEGVVGKRKAEREKVEKEGEELFGPKLGAG